MALWRRVTDLSPLVLLSRALVHQGRELARTWSRIARNEACVHAFALLFCLAGSALAQRWLNAGPTLCNNTQLPLVTHLTRVTSLHNHNCFLNTYAVKLSQCLVQNVLLQSANNYYFIIILIPGQLFTICLMILSKTFKYSKCDKNYISNRNKCMFAHMDMISPVEIIQSCIVKRVIKGGHGVVHNWIEFSPTPLKSHFVPFSNVVSTHTVGNKAQIYIHNNSYKMIKKIIVSKLSNLVLLIHYNDHISFFEFSWRP